MEWQLELYRLNNAEQLLTRAARYLDLCDYHAAATALDHAYALRPHDRRISGPRRQLLEQLARQQDGVEYRYVPGGYFLMGSKQGDPDERPVHLVRTDAFWIAETPVDWAQFCRVLNYAPPPLGLPAQPELLQAIVNGVRLQYCEDHTDGAHDWHTHYYDATGTEGWPYQLEREPLPHGYSRKPAVSINWQEADHFCQRAKTRLPNEAEWEKAARGGLTGQRYPWGNQPPTQELCDFNRFEDFSIRPVRSFAPNGYGLYGMSGGVWEWTSTRYDALAYRGHAPAEQAEQYVVRGGSWADCAEAVTVSFRGSRPADVRHNPNQGFRVCLI